MMLPGSMLLLSYFITYIYVGKDFSSYILLFIWYCGCISCINRISLTLIFPAFFNISRSAMEHHFIGGERKFRWCRLHHIVDIIEKEIMNTTLVVGAVQDIWQNACFIFLGVPSITIFFWSGDKVNRATVSEWLRLDHSFQEQYSKWVSVVVRNEWAIKYTQAILVVVRALTKSIEEGRFADGCTYCLWLSS